MPNSLGKSLTNEEQNCREAFQRLDRERADTFVRANAWSALIVARDRGVQHLVVPFVAVRMREDPLAVAFSIVGTISGVTSAPNPLDSRRSAALVGSVPCDVLFDARRPAGVPPCERPGPCPHEVSIYILEEDNDDADNQRLAMRRLRTEYHEGPLPSGS